MLAPDNREVYPYHGGFNVFSGPGFPNFRLPWLTFDQLVPGMDPAVWRILDVELNRVAEGLRVVEEYLRLVLNDRHLARLAKELRHQLQSAAADLPEHNRLALRDTLGDVGAQISTPAERQRDDLWHVAKSSFSRVQQGLRTLEEYGKLVDAEFAQACERLRYDLYTLEKSAGLTSASLSRLEGALLCALIDGLETPQQFEAHVGKLIEVGVPMIQLRDKRLADAELLDRARRLVALTRPRGTLVIVNDRADIAAAAEADGVHVGQQDLPPAAARRVVGPRALVGLSTHSLDQDRQGVLAGVDYLGVGPTFASTTKAFDTFPGLELLRQVAQEIALPAFAIGGISLDNLPQVLETGLRRVAVAAALQEPSVGGAMLEILRAGGQG